MKKLLILLTIQILTCVTYLNAQQGLTGDYYTGKDFNRKVFTRIDPTIDFFWKIGAAPATGIDPGLYSIRWTGRLQAPVSGTYTFSAQVDDGIRVWVGNIQVLNGWGMNDMGDFSGSVVLEAGKKYDLKIEYFNGLREGEIKLLWELPTEKSTFFGHNYKPIAKEYLFLATPAKAAPPLSKTTVSVPQKPAAKPTAQPVITTAKQVTKPIVKPVMSPPQNKRVEPQTSKPTIAQASKPPVQNVPNRTTKPVDLDTATRYIPKNVLFVKSKPTMLPESFVELDNLAAMLKRFPNKKVIVDGHTDNVGDVALNRKLSEERAQAVVEYLIKKGVAESRLSSRGFGDTHPITNENTPEGHARNRRVEFIIEK